MNLNPKVHEPKEIHQQSCDIFVKVNKNVTNQIMLFYEQVRSGQEVILHLYLKLLAYS